MKKLIELDIVISNSYLIIEQLYINDVLPCKTSSTLGNYSSPLSVAISEYDKFSFNTLGVTYSRGASSTPLSCIDMSNHFLVSDLMLPLQSRIKEYLIDLIQSTLEFLESFTGKGNVKSLLTDAGVVFYEV